jgi:hypothetical protein
MVFSLQDLMDSGGFVRLELSALRDHGRPLARFTEFKIFD